MARTYMRNLKMHNVRLDTKITPLARKNAEELRKRLHRPLMEIVAEALNCYHWFVYRKRTDMNFFGDYRQHDESEVTDMLDVLETIENHKKKIAK